MDPLRKVAALEPTKKAVSLLEDFKSFAFKGNVIDLAVGVMIGAAFGKLIESLVKNLLMPLISLIPVFDTGYEAWTITMGTKSIPIGAFLGDVVNFLIVALALYLFIIKFLGWVMRARKEEPAPPPPLTREEELLTEIRDLLAKRPTSA